MLEHYSHVRQEAKRRALESLDNLTITSQLAKWEAKAEQRDVKKPNNEMVGTGRFELPTPRTPSECSTRLSHVPTRKDSTDATAAMPAAVDLQRRGSPQSYTTKCYSRSLQFGPTPISTCSGTANS